jgi:hypothetical protein
MKTRSFGKVAPPNKLPQNDNVMLRHSGFGRSMIDELKSLVQNEWL